MSAATATDPNTKSHDKPADPLLGCLAILANHFSLPFSAGTALAGLPMETARLTPDLAVRAAAALGLDAAVRNHPPSKTPAVVAPFIAMLGEDAVVVEHIDHKAGLASVAAPAPGGALRQRLRLDDLDNRSSGAVIYATRTDRRQLYDQTVREDAGFGGSVFWRVVLGYWPSWVMVVIAALMINLLGLASPLFIMNVYDRVIPNLAIPTLWALVVGVVIALAFDAILKQLRAGLLDQTGRRVDMRVGASLFQHVIAVKMEKLPAGSGGLANTIREFETVRDFFTSASIIALTDFLFIGVFVMVLFLIVGPLAWVPLIAVPAVLILTLLIRVPMRAAIADTMKQVSNRQSLLVESLTGLEAIRAVAGEGKRQRDWESAVAASAKSASRSKFWSALASNATYLVTQSVSIITITWGVFLVIEGQITIGALIAANILGGRVLAPLGNIAQTLARSSQAFQSMRNISALMALPTEDTVADAGDAEVRAGGIEFQSATFSYPNAAMPALRDFNLAIRPGDRVGIVGSIGAGKSTIGRLLAGLYEPTEGKLLIDGIDIHQYNRRTLRSAIAYCSQEPVLFAGSIRDNIAMGHTLPSDDDIAFAARVAGVELFANQLPDGLMTQVSERGGNLSGGQRQAIAIARNLVRRPKVLFLDEPTSAMDARTEAQFLQGLLEFSGPDRTLIIATHKASVLQIVNRMVVIDAGRVALAGPTDKVLEKLGQLRSQPQQQAAAKQRPPDKAKRAGKRKRTNGGGRA